MVTHANERLVACDISRDIVISKRTQMAVAPRSGAHALPWLRQERDFHITIGVPARPGGIAQHRRGELVVERPHVDDLSMLQ